MSLDEALQFVPKFVLVVFRLAGFMIFAPLLGSAKIPRRLKTLMALVLAAGMCSSVRTPVNLPQTTWELALGIGGEIAFGLAMGTILSFTFVAAQWAGEIISQQMGLNLSEVFDPQYSSGGSLIGDLYYMLTLVVFLAIGGHRQMILGVWQSFNDLPLLSLSIDRNLLDTLIELLKSCTMLAMQLAAPMLVTMLVVDLSLGCIGKTMPQVNVMTAGMSIRSLLGLVIIFLTLTITTQVLSTSLKDSLNIVQTHWTRPTAATH